MYRYIVSFIVNFIGIFCLYCVFHIKRVVKKVRRVLFKYEQMGSDEQEIILVWSKYTLSITLLLHNWRDLPLIFRLGPMHIKGLNRSKTLIFLEMKHPKQNNRRFTTRNDWNFILYAICSPHQQFNKQVCIFTTLNFFG